MSMKSRGVGRRLPSSRLMRSRMPWTPVQLSSWSWVKGVSIGCLEKSKLRTSDSRDRLSISLGRVSMKGGVVFGFRSGLGDDGVDAGADEGLFWIATGGFDLGLEGCVVALGLGQAVVGDEDALGPAGGEFLAAAGLAGLDQHGVPLGGPGDGKGTARLKKFAVVVEAVDFLGVGRTGRSRGWRRWRRPPTHPSGP